MGRKKLSIEEKTRCLTLLEEGKSVIDVATDMKVSRQSIYNLKTQGLSSRNVPPRKPGSGGKRKTSMSTDQLLKREVMSDPCITAAQLKRKHPELLNDISTRTIQHRLQKELNLPCRRAITKPLHTDKMRKKKESGRKLRKVKTRKKLEVDIVESDFPPDPLQTLNDDKNDNNCKELLTKPDSLQSQVNSLGNILVQTVHNPLHSSSNFSGSHDDLMGKEGLETEFDLFAKSVGKQLNSMPPKDALQLQLKIQEVINNFTQQMSFITPNKPSTDVPPLCDENFIDIKMEITDDFIE
ncbi:UNVERIFIED_CONTAM: hypothetical protein RMT77_003576 [Armadillidium vulgare]